VAPARLKRSFSDREWEGNGAVAAEMGDIRADIMRMSRVASPTVGIKTQLLTNRYEEIVGALLIRIGVFEDRLKWQTPVASAASYTATATRGAHPVASPAAPVAPLAPVAAPRKIRETWSAVVACDDPALSGRQIAEKIRKEVAPALGVRVHEVRELKRGGAIIRTPSQAEMTKVVASAKFAEVGLKEETDTGRLGRLICSHRC